MFKELGEFMDNNGWIKSQLNKIFSRQVTNDDLQDFVADKLKMFNCKLYKYYSFRNFPNFVVQPYYSRYDC